LAAIRCTHISAKSSKVKAMTVRHCRDYCLGTLHLYGYCPSCGRRVRSAEAWRDLPVTKKIRLWWHWRWTGAMNNEDALAEIADPWRAE
jgi:hypothetical protein